jgi:hypothetical protein
MRNGTTFPNKGKIRKYLKEKMDQYNIPESSEDKLYSQLTGNGMRMDYFLGKNIHDRFEDFLKEDISHINQVHVVSSPVKACSLSAQNVLLSVFGPVFDSRTFYDYRNYSQPPFHGETPDDKGINTALPRGYYPLPVHTTSQDYNDIFMAYSPEVCNWFANLNNKSKKILEKYIDVINQALSQEPILKSLLKEIKKSPSSTALKVENHSDVDDLVDFLRSMRSLDQTFGLNSSVFYSLTLTQDIISSSYYFDKLGLQIILTPILRHLLVQFDKMLLSVSRPMDRMPYPKFSLYSGNEVIIWAFLQAFNLSSTSCLEDLFDRKIIDSCLLRPEFGSSLIFELYQNDDDEEIMIGRPFPFPLDRNQTTRFLINRCHLQRETNRKSD